MSTLHATVEVLTNLRRYLTSRYWRKIDHPNPRIEVYQTPPDETGDFASAIIPVSVDLRDADNLIREAIRLVADHENLPFSSMVDRVVRWNRDILRMRFLKVVGHEDTLPLGIASGAVSGVKEFLGYAAYTHTDPKPFFDKAGAISGRFSNGCLFGHTFEGSFGLTIESPFAVVEELPLPGLDPMPPPLERQIIERVANGLGTLRQSIESDSVDPIIAGYLTGFSANMCRKLAEIYEHVDGRRVEYDISWSPQLPSACERTWRPLVFEGRAYDFVRVAATELERAETFPDSLVQGRIVVLKSEMPPGLDEQAEFEHIITMSWERERGQQVKIRVPLSPKEYIQACDAHKEGRSITIYGVPEKAGKFWTLTKAHDFEC